MSSNRKLEGAHYGHCGSCVEEGHRSDIEVLMTSDKVQLWCRHHNTEIALLTLAIPISGPPTRERVGVTYANAVLPVWWVSFADDSGFIGAMITRSKTLDGAIEHCMVNGMAEALVDYPNAEAMGYSGGLQTEAELDPYEVNRIYIKSEIESLGGALPMKDL